MRNRPSIRRSIRPALLNYHRLLTLLFALNLGIGFSYIGLWLVTIRQGLFWRADFTAFYTAFTMVRDGDGSRLYDFALQTTYQQRILGGRSFSDGLLPFINPPYVAAIFAPLAWVSHWSAFVLWMLVQVGILIWMLRLLWIISSEWSRGEQWLMVSACVAFLPLYLSLTLGSFSLLLVVALLQLYWTLKHGRDLQAGLWLVIGTIKPQIVVFPIITLVGNRRWRVLGSMALVLALLFVLIGVLFGWHIWTDFLGALRQTNSFYDQFGIVPTAMYNLKGILALLLGTQHGDLISRICDIAFFIAAGVSCMLWRRVPLQDDPQFELRFGLSILVGLFFSPHLHPQDGAMVIVPALLFYMYLRRHQLHRTGYGLFLLLSPLVCLIGEFGIGTSLGVRIPTLIIIALLIWMTHHLIAASGNHHTLTRSTARP